MSGLRQHGGAVDVVLAANVEKDVPVYISGFHGFTLDRGVTGDVIAIDTSESIWEFPIGSVTGTLGTTLYISTDGNHTISASAGANKVPFAKVVKAKNASNYVWAKQLPQVAVVPTA